MRMRVLFSAGCVAFAVVSAGANSMAQDDTSEEALASPPISLDDIQYTGLPPLSPEEMAVLAEALTFDPSTLDGIKTGKTLKLPGRHDRAMFDLDGTAKPNAGTVVLKPALPLEWDARVGADVGLPADAMHTDRAINPLPVDRNGSGAAWASVGVPNLATIDARVDPGNDQGRLATTFKQSIPLGGKMSVILQNSYAVTETFSPTVTQSTDLPLMSLPQDATSQTTRQVWSSEQALKFNILSTGTTLSAGVHSTSTDPVTHNTLSAEQKLLGPLNVTTAVTDIGQTGVNKRVTAGFKLNW